MLKRSPLLSFEIVSTREGGVRYVAVVEEKLVDSVTKAINSFMAEAKVRQVEYKPDKLHSPRRENIVRVIEFKQTGHYVLPLGVNSRINDNDPLSYVLGAMSNLSEDEAVSLQLVVKPVIKTEVKILAKRLMNNEDILVRLRSNSGESVSSKASGLMRLILLGVSGLFNEVYTSTAYGYKEYYSQRDKDLLASRPVNNRERPARVLSSFESELMASMNEKLNSPLFEVSLRVVITSSRDKIRSHRESLVSSLDSFGVPLYQSLKPRIGSRMKRRINYRLCKLRLLSLRQSKRMVLSSGELSSLYHFPSSSVGRTDNLIESLSRTLPAPVSMKQSKSPSYLIGENIHHGVTTPIGLSRLERERHMYILGGTGNGKTTMLLYGIMQDIKSGRGLAVIDPHGDLAEDIISRIPDERIKDVIYLNPDDLAYPIGINLLEMPKGLAGDDLVRAKDQVTEMALSVLRKLFSEDDMGGHRIEYILRNAIQTALTIPDATIFTVYELLNNPAFRHKTVAKLKDPHLELFWRHEFSKAGDMQRVKMAAGITAKIGRLLFSGSAKRVLGQKKSTIDFDTLMDEKKILVCNFSKGLLGEDTSTLFGTMILAKLQLASLRRARQANSKRLPFYVYVDEFQNFATMSFVQMLSEARKYKLYLILAEQSTSQQEKQRLVEVILANVGTVVSFRSGNPSDERYILPLFSPFINEGEIANLPTYSFYAKLSGVDAQEPMSGRTVLVSSRPNLSIRQRVIDESRKQYAGIIVENILTIPAPNTDITNDSGNGKAKKVGTKKYKVPSLSEL